MRSRAAVLLLLIILISRSHAAIIQNTKIQRLGSDLEMSWEYNPAYPVDSVDIWVLSGEKIEFAGNVSRYSKINTVKGNLYKDTLLKTGDRQNCYYRIVPEGTPREKIFDDNLNDRTIAKFDLEIKKGLNLIAAPVIPQSGNQLSDILGSQLTENDQVIYFDNKDKDYRIAVYTPKGWEFNRDFGIYAGQGLFINARRNAVITFAGRVLEDYKPVIFDGNNLIGNSTPQTKEINKDLFGLVLSGSFLIPQDALCSYDPANKASLFEGNFIFSKEFLLSPGKGFWYQRKSPKASIFAATFESGSAGATFQILPPKKARDRNNKASLETGCAVQFLTSIAPPNNSGSHVSEGKLLLTGKIGGGIPVPTSAPASFSYFIGDHAGDVYIRVWDTADISGSVKGRSYANLGPFGIPSAPSSPQLFDLDSFYTRYLCEPPAPPEVRVDEIELQVINRRGDTRVAFTLVPIINRDSPIEVAPNPKKFMFLARKKFSKNWDRQYTGNGPITINGDSYYQPGLEYEVVAAAANHFGVSEWNTKNILNFTVPTIDQESPIEWSFIKNLTAYPKRETVKLTIDR